jgi:predicted acyl esterase
MLTRDWKTSQRKYRVVEEKDFEIPVSDGTQLNSYLYRPDAEGKFPVILGVCAYSLDDQIAPVTPIGTGGIRGHMEAGDPNFYVARGYVHVIMNVRGTGKSGGLYDPFGAQETRDIYDAIEWLARRSWCNGKVGMFGPSYFAISQKRVAALNPPSLKCIFAMYGLTDLYRDLDYHGGILHHNFRTRWIPKLANLRFKNKSKERLGETEYRRRIQAALEDPEVAAIPALVEALRDPDRGRNSLIIEPLLFPLDGEFWEEWRAVGRGDLKVPAYLGSCWGVYGLHLRGDAQSWEEWQGPKKFTVGPPIYLDRPIYQYQYESLRWFDHWLKDINTGILDEPRVHVFLDGGDGEWVETNDWPLPQTRWTPFYLHEKGLLSEHEFWPGETPTAYVDSPYERGSVTFRTPPLVEATDVCGPMALTLYAATTDSEVLWFIQLLEVNAKGAERLLTRGWLRGSQRRLDADRSQPWLPYHSHDRRESLRPNEIYEFHIDIRPYGIRLRPGHRLAVRISSHDGEPPTHHLHGIGSGHVARQSSSRVTIYHDANRPSHLLVPVTRGNRIGTFISGGIITA